MTMRLARKRGLLVFEPEAAGRRVALLVAVPARVTEDLEEDRVLEEPIPDLANEPEGTGGALVSPWLTSQAEEVAETTPPAEQPTTHSGAEAALLAVIVTQAEEDGRLSTEELGPRGLGQSLKGVFRRSLGRAALSSGWFRYDPTALLGPLDGLGIILSMMALFGGLFLIVPADANGDQLVPGFDYLGIGLLALLIFGLALFMLRRDLPRRSAEGARLLGDLRAQAGALHAVLAESTLMDRAQPAAHGFLPFINSPDELVSWSIAFGLSEELGKVLDTSFEAGAPHPSWRPDWYAGDLGGVGVFIRHVASAVAAAR